MKDEDENSEWACRQGGAGKGVQARGCRQGGSGRQGISTKYDKLYYVRIFLNFVNFDTKFW